MGIRIACCLKNFIAVENEDPEVLPPSMPNSEPSYRSHTPSVQRNNRGHGCPENSVLVVQYYIRKPVLALAYRKKTLRFLELHVFLFLVLNRHNPGTFLKQCQRHVHFFRHYFFKLTMLK